MNKSILVFAIGLSIISCKSDVKSGQVEADNVQTTANAQGIEDSLAVVQAQEAAEAAKIEEENRLLAEAKIEEDRKRAEKKAKRKSFNPPHIAVLEQEYQSSEEIVEKPKPKPKPRPSPQPKPVKRYEAPPVVQQPTTTTTVSQQAPVSNTTVVSQSTRVTSPITSNNAPISSSSTAKTEIVFKRNFFSFGDIVQGDTIRFNFDFTNIGDAPLIIEDAKGSCSCTLPEIPLMPIAPGETGKISGIYVSDDKKGPQNASVTVKANTDPATHQLLLDGSVSISEDK